MTEHIYDIDIQLEVHESVVRMYDRYMEVVMAAKTKEPPLIMSFSDFINQILVRGLVNFALPLAALEKELGIT